jgi:hypothetical protein
VRSSSDKRGVAEVRKVAGGRSPLDKTVMTKRSTKTIKKTVAPMRLMETEALRRQRIEQRAYERFESRGCVHGHDVEDWLAAESEITSAHA